MKSGPVTQAPFTAVVPMLRRYSIRVELTRCGHVADRVPGMAHKCTPCRELLPQSSV